MSLFKKLLGVCVCSILLLATALFAEVPKAINFSGSMSRNSQSVNGDFDISIRVLDAFEEVLWVQNYTDVTFKKGQFSIKIGNNAEVPLSTSIISGAKYLEVVLGEDNLLMDFTSTFYSRISELALTATTADVALVALAAQSVDWENVADKPDFLVTSDSASASAGDVLAWDGSNWITTSSVNLSSVTYYSGSGLQLSSNEFSLADSGVIS